MLELGESLVISQQLYDTLAHKTIVDVLMNESPHKFLFCYGDLSDYPFLLSGKIITGASPNGGQVEVHAEEMRLVFTDGANIKYYHTDEKLPKKHQMHIRFDDGSSIICTIQMYGGIFVFKDGQIDHPYYLKSKNSPSPLSETFDDLYFDELLSKTNKQLSAKAFLATEQRIPGLGNGVLQDILFNARINPQQKMAHLNDEAIENLYLSVKKTLFEMCAKGGRDTEKDLFNVSGGYKTIMSKKTYQAPCPVCGSKIIKKAYLGGSVYFCSLCQGL